MIKYMEDDVDSLTNSAFSKDARILFDKRDNGKDDVLPSPKKI